MLSAARVTTIEQNDLQSSIGRPVDELMTPALLLDLAVVRSNINRMAACTRGPTRLRPHFKSHKCI